ncbi:nucleoside recognition domain-containing protein [uncultured Fluviicola sp.]|uniref:nucleoside recognition domain-containing protein n=1 Tax=uncultured Fluviicola sp. TaxID=463303 RepID=UPI002600D110|nr:nucleoside recognition domain-containing protein [uncultured Fluviicola sp.]
MVLNRVWIGMFVIAIIMGFSKLLFWQDTFILQKMMDALFEAAKSAFELALYMTGILALWMGLMKIGEDSGAVNILSRMVYPLFSKLFPDIPKNHPAMGSIMLNFSANMLGLDNAATPAGLRAMQQLQDINPEKETASNAQIMFLVLNASGLTIIPVSILATRAAENSQNPASVFIPILLTTYFATLGGLIFVAIRQKINLFQRNILLYIGGLTTLIIGLLWYLNGHPKEIDTISRVLSTTIIFGFITFFIVMALKSKIQAYESFIEGAKGGFQVALNIVPYLVAMLCAVALFRSCGALEDLINNAKYLLTIAGIKALEFVDALPVILMKPFSGSGARGLMVENMKAFGPDSFVSNLSATFQGSTETTFYVLSVYFGSVGIKKTRYAATAGLFCDLVGAIAAVLIAYLFFS